LKKVYIGTKKFTSDKQSNTNIISNGSVASLSSRGDKIDKKVILNPEEEEQSALPRQD
jgi:hypothetical protein